MHWIRVVYLYLFALVGLVLVTVGGVQMVSLGLRTWVLTEADAEMRMHYYPDPPMRFAPERAAAVAEDTVVALTQQEREAFRHWAADYERQRQIRAEIDPVRSRRQREAARAIALLLVGAPLFGYHWRAIRKERAGYLA
ncbi:MAG TPA: hypothetical protein VMM12_05245 [Longimicrobiales bacterium]|nr:hypothetical protein [Longimicrobiales bacterium]